MRETSFTGTRTVAILCFLFYVLQATLLLAVIAYVLVGGDRVVGTVLENDEWRLYLYSFGKDVYASFPAEWGGNAQMLEQPAFCMAVYAGSGILLENIPMAYVFWQAARILRQVEKKGPFVLENAEALRRIGITLILVGTLGAMLIQIITPAVVFHRFYMMNPWEIPYILAGIMILVVEKVFRYGCQLQEDADLTI